MVVAKKYVLLKPFDGFPTDEFIGLQEEQLPALGDGDVLFEATFLSVDPYTRVTESKNPAYPVGSQYVAKFGWRSHTVCNPSAESSAELEITPLPQLGSLSPSLALGAAGMTGTTAHIALLNTCQLKDGETVMVTGAAGAVGSVVGQIARIKIASAADFRYKDNTQFGVNLCMENTRSGSAQGSVRRRRRRTDPCADSLKNCTVIGCAGTDDKVQWLKKMGFTHVFNYKTSNVADTLKTLAPKGIDVFFDNVGGDMSGQILNNHMATLGRMVCVGNISGYNAKEPATGPWPMSSILMGMLTVKGFVIFAQPPEQIQKALTDLIGWLQEGKLQAREHVTKGFENMREAFYGLFKGSNTGKAIVEV